MLDDPHAAAASLAAEAHSPLLGFADGQERAYQAFAFENHGGARGWAGVALQSVLLALLAADAYRAWQAFVPLFTPALLVTRLTAIGLVALCSWWLGRSDNWQSGQFWLRAMLLVVGLSAAAGSALQQLASDPFQMPQAVAGNLVMVMALFLPLGQRYLDALKVALGCALVAWLILPQFLPAALLKDFYPLLPLQLAGLVVAALTGYQQEKAMRALFLMQQSVTLMANTDTLTGLGNRHAFEPFVQRAMLQAAREGQQVALLLLGMDQFKSYNDLQGHAAGDAALKALARVVSQRIRRQFDMGARLGGEEFALFFFDANIGFAWTVAEELRRDVEKRLAITHPGNVAGVLTISLGAAVSAPGESFERLYQRADQALLTAKTQGRNQVQLAE